MRISVVLCEHSMERYDDCVEAAESVLGQTHDDVELVLVSDGSDRVCEAFRDDFGDDDTGDARDDDTGDTRDDDTGDTGDDDTGDTGDDDTGDADVLVHCLDENVGLLEARNAGAAVATGDVVAFVDDDALAAPDWLERLAAAYEGADPGERPAVGGKMVPEWVAGEPASLPAEFYWLVGVTHRGFADGPGEVRNTFGSNISFRREVFRDLGGFESDIGGRTGDANLQGGETELCARMADAYGHGVYYVPEAEVAHKVFEYRTDLGWLLDRAFWQGYSKRGMEVFVPESTGEESDFARDLLVRYLPDRARGLASGPSLGKLLELVMVVVFTVVVGLGYLYGYVKFRPSSAE